MTSQVKVTVKDNGFNRARALLRKPRMILSVGVHPAEAAQTYPDRPSVTVGMVATVHEYGIGVPVRSWLFGWLYEEADLISRQMAADTKRVLFGNPPESEGAALAKRGSVYRQQIEDRIRYANVFDSNADSTVAKKGFDLPLIDSELFIESIRWEVREP